MAQKFAIGILVLALLLAIGGIYWYVSSGNQILISKQKDLVLPEKNINTTTTTNDIVSATTSTKPMPTEAEVEAQVEKSFKKLNEVGKTRRLTTDELMYFDDPNAAAIKDLTK